MAVFVVGPCVYDHNTYSTPSASISWSIDSTIAPSALLINSNFTQKPIPLKKIPQVEMSLFVQPSMLNWI